MTTIAEAKVLYTADVTSLERGNARALSSTQQFAKAQEGMLGSTRQLGTAQTQLFQNTNRVNQQFQGATRSTQSLSQTMQGLVGGVTGASVASIALGAAIGGVLMSAVIGLVRGLGEAATATARFHNELLLIPTVGPRAAESLALIESIAASSNTTLADLRQRYVALAQGIQGTLVTLEEANRGFREQEALLTQLRQATIGSATGKLLEETAATVLEFDKLLGISNLIIGSLTVISEILRGVRHTFLLFQELLRGGGAAAEEETRIIIRGAVMLNFHLRQQALIEEELVDLDIRRRSLTGALAGDAAREVELRRQLRQVTRDITEQRAADIQEERARLPLVRAINQQLQQELQVAGLSRNEQEIRTRLFQFQLQFLQAGAQLTREQTAEFERQLRTIQGITIAQREMQAAAQNLVTALSGIPVAFGNIFTTSGLTTLQGGLNSFTQELTTFHTAAFENAFSRMDAAMRQSGATAAEIFAIKRQLLLQEQGLVLDTASKAAQAITAIFPKNKAAAIGAAVINTAVAITKALQLPFPFNWAQAALVAATGAAQIAAIRSASPTGGSTPTVGGGGAAAGGDAGGAAPQMFIVEMKAGALFSTEQVVGLMELFNEQVKNGNALISTRVT